MRLRDRLAALYPEPAPADPDVRDALERSLLESLPVSQEDTSSIPSPNGTPRRKWIFGAFVGLSLAAACTTPTDYSMEFGHRIAFEVTTEDFDPNSLSKHIRERFEGVDEIRIAAALSKKDDGHGTVLTQFNIAIDVVGDVNVDAIEVSLLEQFDALEVSDVDVESIGGTVHGTLGGMLSHRAVGWVVDGDDADDARERVLAELASRGIDDPRSVDIDIEEHNGPFGRKREVRVRVKADEDDAQRKSPTP